MFRRIAATALLVVTHAAFATAQTSEFHIDKKSITVSVTRSVSVLADTATLTISYENDADDPKLAYAQSDEEAGKIIRDLRHAFSNLRIESTKLTLSQADAGSNSAIRSSRSKLIREWTVRVPAIDVDKLNSLAIIARATRISGLIWSLADRSNCQKQAEDKAAAYLTAYANELASNQKRKLGKEISRTNAVRLPAFSILGEISDDLPATSDPTSTTILPGLLRCEASLTVTYEFH
jgi:uncharacterized protein YggE